jgi:hypothetical protein
MRPVHAQNDINWELPQRIPGIFDRTWETYPAFFADSQGKIHLLNSQSVQGRIGIVYSQWIEQVGWTLPIDIIYSPIGDANIQGVYLDEDDIVNVVFWGGNYYGAELYFTQAPLYDARKTSAWSKPIVIGKNVNTPITAKIVSLRSGFMMVVFSSHSAGNGLYYVSSDNGGKNWTDEKNFFLADNDFLWPDQLQIIQSENNLLHAVWALGDRTGNSRKIYYANYQILDDTWNQPSVLAEAIAYEADTPSIIQHDNSIFIIYHNSRPTTRWMTRSFDEGITWTTPVRLFEQVGSNGAAALLVDEDGYLHMFFGNRVGGRKIVAGLWHSIWTANQWSIPDPIVTRPGMRQGANGTDGFDPSHAQAILAKGNRIFLSWQQDIAWGEHVWFTFTKDSSEQNLITQSSQQQSTQPTITPSTLPLPSLTPTTPPGTFFTDPQQETTNPTIFNVPIITGAISTLFFLSFTLFYAMKKKK